MERIDIQKDVKTINYFGLSDEDEAPPSAVLRARVEKARRIQQERYENEPGISCNAQMTTSLLKKYCQLDEKSSLLMKNECTRRGYSARVIHKLLRLARTAADLDESADIKESHVRQALDCRDLDKSNEKMYVVGKWHD